MLGQLKQCLVIAWSADFGAFLEYFSGLLEEFSRVFRASLLGTIVLIISMSILKRLMHNTPTIKHGISILVTIPIHIGSLTVLHSVHPLLH